MTGWRDTAVAILTRVTDASTKERLVISFAAFVLSMIVGGFIVLGAGFLATCGDPFLSTGFGTFCYDPLQVYFHLFVSPFLTPFDFALMAKETTLLLFTGLSVAVAFRAGLFNIGTQGQLIAGALSTALAVLWLGDVVPAGIVGTLILVPTGLLVGAVFGGLYAAIPGALKAYADANEVITTIMLNFIAANVAFFLVSTYFQDPNSQSIETLAIPTEAKLTPILGAFANAPFSIVAFGVALALVFGVYYVLWHTAFGYDLRTSGLQPAAADFAGVDAKRMIVASMVLSGALGGIGGAVWVMMVLGRWRTGVPAIGFDGITVSILAGNNPLGVIPAAILFGLLKSGSLAIDFALGVPKQLVGVLRGLVILFVAMPEFFRMIGLRLDLTTREELAADGGDDDG